MDAHYLRLRRRRLLWRSFAICVFFGLLSLPLLYLLSSEIRKVAAAGYHYAIGKLEAARAGDGTAPSAAIPAEAAPAPITSTQAQAAPIAVAQAQPAPSRPPASPPPRTAKLGETTFRIPAGYVESDADLKGKSQLLLRALLPDLAPRATGKGNCTPDKQTCPDFAVIKIGIGNPSVESALARRYKVAPSQLPLIAGPGGLRQIPPRQARLLDGRQFLVEPAGRWVWITCRDLERPASRQPMPGICVLAFDTADRLNVKVRFRQERLRDWAAIHAKTVELIGRLKG